MSAEPGPLSVALGLGVVALLTLVIALAWSWAGPRIQRWVDSLPEGEPERSRLDDLDPHHTRRKDSIVNHETSNLLDDLGQCLCGSPNLSAVDPRETVIHSRRMCYVTRREDQQ